MLSLRRTITRLLWPMAVLLPLWLTFGRALLGSGGWGTLIYLIYIAPVLLVALSVITILIRQSPRFKLEWLVTDWQAILLSLLYGSIFLHGFFLVDGGDSADSINSVATKLLGSGFQDASAMLSIWLYFAAVILLAVMFVAALAARFRVLRNPMVAVAAVLLCVIAGVLIVVQRNAHSNSPTVKDDDVSYDFQLMRQDISFMMHGNGIPPSGSAKDLASQGEYGKQFHIAKRADAYTYTPLPEQHSFKLCARFATDTMGDYPGTADGSDNENFHHAGYQCFTYGPYY